MVALARQVTSLLVVAGEASGDRAGAAVVERVRARWASGKHGDCAPATAVRAWGLGGVALRAAGVRLIGDANGFSAMGLGSVAGRAFPLAATLGALVRDVRRAPPNVALLVGFSEANRHIARLVHRRGARVLWYMPPQVWAWRGGRVARIRPHVDRVAVVLPFEESLWRAQGVDATFVGHPLRDVSVLDRQAARCALGLSDRAPCVAILPGSRAHEVRSLLVPFLDAYLHVQDDRTSVDGRVLVAAHLDRETRDLIHRAALARRIKAVDMPAESGAAPYLAAFDGALCASGTAALECAISGAVPVIAYRVDRVTALVARRLLRTPFVGLPNVLLGAAVYPELLQERAEPRALAEALEHVLDGRAAYDASRSRLAALFEGCTERPADAVASMLLPWIAGGGRGRSALSATEVVGGDLS